MRRKRKSSTIRKDTSTKARKTAKIKGAAQKRREAAPKTRNNGTWSESEYFQRVRSALRRSFRFWKPMQNALQKASRPNQSSNKRLKKEFQCAICKKWFKRADVQIDHIEECGSLLKPEDIAPFLERLTKEDDGAYQVLCRKHHSEKTQQYFKERKKK